MPEAVIQSYPQGILAAASKRFTHFINQREISVPRNETTSIDQKNLIKNPNYTQHSQGKTLSESIAVAL